ncbi:MAG: restriction endonuclease [Oceanospirillaceae bacterium]|uniref:McrC family protein n=1 Tax=unclassified Thalassolituus TaxID=2624967 RepID=UPI000C555C2D|nr:MULTISPECIES: McrC family protein [unclassified Thalassolituus]MAX99821.1 restriction endonuclease [Oceanospirillaceae bacterium]MBS53730.1 restriction endonuclease [Oceanospirillaceae bacterium]|tara:strand:- start:2781 stop:4106 length:1326 start_codon:yes stop_codon:yes gene_type:complete
MIQVREFARLTTDHSAAQSLDCGVVSAATFAWLQDIAAEWKKSEPVALIDGHRSLKLGSYVGFLQSPAGESIEILPKTRLGEEDPLAARRILQRMLLASLGIKPRSAGAAELLRIREPLHEWIFSQFLAELQGLVKRGLRFDYQRVDEESRFIRGQLRIDQQQRQPPGRQHLFHIRHDIYTADRLENRLLKTALSYVLSNCKSGENWRLANELMHLMAEIPKEPDPLRAISRWQSGKLMQMYDEVRPWCELILEKLNPNFQKGLHRGIALLFPMEQLFEKYVEVCLRRGLPPGSRLKAQASSEYLLQHRPQGSDITSRMFQLKPDLMLQTALGNQVLDTKWKLLEESAWTADKKYNIAQADLYQMFAYGHKYQNGNGHMMLIYPCHESFNAPLPVFWYSDLLALWVVPFSLESNSLIGGKWGSFFEIHSQETMRKDVIANG